MTSPRPRLDLAVSTLAVTAALGALLLSGQGALDWPPLRAPGEWQAWFTTREPAEAFVALVRAGALVLAWYLLAAIAAGVAARLVGARSLIRITDAVSPSSVRAVVRWALGAGLAASTALAATPAVADRPPATAITMTRLPDPKSRLAAPPAIPPVRALTPAAPASPQPVTTWTVRAGQSLWKIARDVESVRRGRVATDREVSAYWRALIDANRDLLADRQNPHLVFPGQVFRLPPPLAPERGDLAHD